LTPNAGLAFLQSGESLGRLSKARDPGVRDVELVAEEPVTRSAGENTSQPQIRTRQITEGDVDRVAALLHEGFPRRPKDFFSKALAILGERRRFDGCPAYGFMLEADGQPVGVLLCIVACIEEAADALPRLNVSCWYVRPRYRIFGGLLAGRLTKLRVSSILNVSPAPYTLTTIQAQGFRRFSDGVLAAIPVLAVRSRSAKTRSLDGLESRCPDVTAREWQILQDHRAYGCTSLICSDATGTYPFVFQRRRVRYFPFDAAQLVYCRDIATIGLFARSLGAFLAFRGMPWMLVPGNGPISGIPGIFVANKWPMYVKGESAGRPGDFAYTEVAIFGF
jgi:hypothetical protein